jgi:hypothetical protein
MKNFRRFIGIFTASLITLSVWAEPRRELNAELERYTLAHRVIFHAEVATASSQAELDRAAQQLIESLPPAPLRVVLVTSEVPGARPIATLKALPDSFHRFDEARFASLWQEAESAVPAEIRDIPRYLAAWKNLAQRSSDLRLALTEKKSPEPARPVSSPSTQEEKSPLRTFAFISLLRNPLSWLVLGGVGLVAWGAWLKSRAAKKSASSAPAQSSAAKKVSFAVESTSAPASSPRPAVSVPAIEPAPVVAPESVIYFPETVGASPLGAPAGGFLTSELHFGAGKKSAL